MSPPTFCHTKALAPLLPLAFFLSSCTGENAWLSSTQQTLCSAQQLEIVSATASSSEAGHLDASQAIDGNQGSRWSSQFSDPQWLLLDLGGIRYVSSLRIDWESAASSNYSIEVSVDGVAFTEIYNAPDADGGSDTISELDSQTRYLRILSHSRSTQWGNSIYEVTLFGDPNPGCEDTGSSCGDGQLDDGEECDDGNLTPGDGCDAGCNEEQGDNEGVSLPARIEAEDYFTAGESTPDSNSGGACDRGDGVDMQSTQDPQGGGCNIGWSAAGEWVEFNVHSAAGGSYSVNARVSSGSSAASYRLEVDGAAVTETVSVPNQGWGAFMDSNPGMITLSPGAHKLRFVWVAGNVNLNFIELTQEVEECSADSECDDGSWCNGAEQCLAGNCMAGTAPSCDDGDECTADRCDDEIDSCQFESRCLSDLPGRLEAEDYTSAVDLSPGNAGGEGPCDRGDDVDIEVHSDTLGGACNVGWTEAGESLHWQLDAKDGGTYGFVLRAASNSGTSSFHLEANGVKISDSVSVPATGGWQDYVDIPVTSGGEPLIFGLAGGTQVLSLVVDDGGLNLNYLDVIDAGESCSDGIKNQDEVYVDCGGGCAPCPPLGLTERPSNVSCIAGDEPTPGELSLTRIWSDVNFAQPLGLLQAPGDDSEFYVVEKGGRVRALPAQDNATQESTRNYLDLTSGLVNDSAEGGLLGFAFHPDYTINQHAFVAYTTNQGGSQGLFKLRLSRFTSTDGGQTLNLGTELVLLEQWQNSGNHNSGHIAFDNSGLLYMAIGDDDADPHSTDNEANDPNTWRGSILRLDVDNPSSGKNYGIPSGNPFLSGGGAPEVYAYGLRNPWRFSFDRQNNELWAADVGESDWDEVNRIDAGAFYGWPNFEADMCLAGDCGASYVSPIHAYDGVHGSPRSVTGGYVYRGGISSLQGKYVFGDFQLGKVWTLDRDSGQREELFSRSFGLAAWGQDHQGELYYIDLVNGEILRLEESGISTGNAPPVQLFDTGCFASIDSPPVPASGVLPFSVAQKFWSDGAEKERWVAIPDGTSMLIDERGDFELPPGGVSIKHFTWNGKYFESRFFVRYNNGNYGAFTYRWAEDERSATLVDSGGESRQLDGITWEYPSQGQCFQCHTPGANFSLGLETMQLNIEHNFPSTGQTANQFDTLVHLGMVQGNTAPLPAFPATGDDSFSLDERANAYLHINCSSCHRGNTGGRSTWNALSSVPFESKALCNELPINSWSGNASERLIAPGDHTLSTVWLRMHQRDVAAMPPLSQLPDHDGADMLSDWIDSLDSEICSEVTSCNTSSNLVANCNFDNGSTAWTIRVGGGASANDSVIAGEYHMTVQNPGSELWHAQGIQALGSLASGNYAIRFEARSVAPRSIQVEIGEEGDDWSSICAQSIDLTTTMQSYTIDCGGLSPDDNVKLNFNIGGEGNTETVVVDNIYFGLW